MRLALFSDQSWALPELRALTVVALGMQAAVFAFVCWTTVLMVRRKRLFPLALRIELLLLIVAPILNVLLASLLGGVAVTAMHSWEAVVAWAVISSAFA